MCEVHELEEDEGLLMPFVIDVTKFKLEGLVDEEWVKLLDKEELD